MSSPSINLIKDRKTKSFDTTWLQTIKRLLPGYHPEPLTKEQYEQSLVLVIDSSTDYISLAKYFHRQVMKYMKEDYLLYCH